MIDQIVSIVAYADDERTPADFVTISEWGVFAAHVASETGETSRLLGLFGNIDDATRAILHHRRQRRVG